MTARARDGSIDRIKAAAIVAVVVQHATTPAWYPVSSLLDDVLRVLVAFHVPAFLFAAGVLARGEPDFDAKALGRRLVRILVPYLIASTIWYVSGVPAVFTKYSFPILLLRADVLPIYYFVSLIVICNLLMWPLSRAPLYVHAAILVFCFIDQVFAQRMTMTIAPWLERPLWSYRDPFVNYAYFLSGWVIRPYWAAVNAWLRARREWVLFAVTGAIVAICGVQLTVGAPAESHSIFIRTVYVATVIVGILCLQSGSAASAPLRWLSTASYTIYLYHFPLVVWLYGLLQGAPPPARMATCTVAGMAFSWVLVTVGERVLGARSRLLLGT